MEGMKISMVFFKHGVSFKEKDTNEAFCKSPNV